MTTKAALLLVLAQALMLTIPVDAGLYIRWGRTVCAAGSLPVYTGYMATGIYSVAGGGRNYICLADIPQWGNVVNNGVWKPWGAGLYGAQYWFGAGYSNNNPFSYANYNNEDIAWRTAPCVMCSTTRIDVAMIPGLLNCPNDMTTEYSGYLVANDQNTNQASEFICLDQAPEVAKAGGFQNAQGLLIPAEIVCGALPCPNPFVQMNQVSCAVCSV